MASAQYQSWDSPGSGIGFELPAAFSAEITGPAAGVPAEVTRITWGEGEYAGAEVIVGICESGVGLYLTALADARARGEAADYELPVTPFSGGDLETIGADDGFAVTYAEGGALAADERRHDLLYFASGLRRITIDIGYPGSGAERFQEITAHIVDTIVIRAVETAAPPAGESPAAKE